MVLQITSLATPLETFMAFCEGLLALDQDQQCGDNPYLYSYEKLAEAWLEGWEAPKDSETMFPLENSYDNLGLALGD